MTGVLVPDATVTPVETPGAAAVTLVSGDTLDISRLGYAELRLLQWDQERQFAALLVASAPGSAERDALFRLAYDTVTTIHGRILADAGGVVMGYNRRYATLVRRLLARGSAAPGSAGRSRPPHVFEIGYGCGALLAALDGVQVSGIEVSQAMRKQALERVDAVFHDHLYLGNFLTADLAAEQNCDLVFWNDVLEHLVPDEVPAFLRRAYDLLCPGGYLVTITPNWHLRPSDITRDFMPPRTQAVGFHLKEYTLGEMGQLLSHAGFVRVATPLLVTRRTMWLAGRGLAAVKQCCEPALEYLPFGLAALVCRGLGLNCTIAQRPRG